MERQAIKVYDNIFHSFGRGEEILQSENNVTKALINVFEHSHQDLANNFLSEVIELESQFTNNTINYDLQLKKTASKVFSKAFVLGISDDKPVSKSNKIEGSNTGVPDAAFITNDFCMLVEVKIRNAPLTLEQIKRHEKWFLNNQVVSEPIFISWDSILSFLIKERDHLCDVKYEVTKFLINQFLDFCTINGVGTSKSDQFYLLSFPSAIRPIAIDIHNYIVANYESELDKNRQSRSRGISYTRKGRRGFFAKLESVDHILILSIDDKSGIRMQDYLEQLGISRKQKRSSSAWETPSREAWVDLFKIKNLDEIKPLIDEAYKNRP